jgi:hypothetical protein
MRKLEIPPILKSEFATVESIWLSSGETRRVDALILSWVKYEKQLRRLFCFLLFQHPNVGDSEIDDLINVLVENNKLYPHTLIRGINQLSPQSVSKLIGPRYSILVPEVNRIKKYRNKLVHGQTTGMKIRSPQLERDVLWLVDWVSSLAEGAENSLGYDGLRRNTYRQAKSTAEVNIKKFPYSTLVELKNWLPTLNNRG